MGGGLRNGRRWQLRRTGIGPPGFNELRVPEIVLSVLRGPLPALVSGIEVATRSVRIGGRASLALDVVCEGLLPVELVVAIQYRKDCADVHACLCARWPPDQLLAISNWTT